MWETLVGRALGWLPGPVRVGREVSAAVCTYQHGPMIVYAGQPLPRTAPHLDVHLRLWSPHFRTAVRALEATASGQRLEPYFAEMTLEPGAAPAEQDVELYPPDDEELRAQPGDRLKLRLVLTRGWPKRVHVKIKAEGEE